MNAHSKTTSKPHTSTKHSKPYPEKDGEEELNKTAKELSTLARAKLPNRVLQGVLTGYEDDIRQEAILLALSWYLRQRIDTEYRKKHPWNTGQAIAGSLRIQKRGYIKALKTEAETLRRIPPENAKTSLHPAMRNACDWSASTKGLVTDEAIRIALRAKRISHTNALLAKEVLVNGAHVSHLAELMSVNRSNIYQHLSRVRREIRGIIQDMEVPMIDSL